MIEGSSYKKLFVGTTPYLLPESRELLQNPGFFGRMLPKATITMPRKNQMAKSLHVSRGASNACLW